MASCCLQPRLIADHPDPENLPRKHADPIGWTRNNRGQILAAALYTLLLGHPRLYNSDPTAAETRFKRWFDLVGSAVEHAARLHAECANVVSSTTPRTVLDVLRSKWPNGFMACDVAAFARGGDAAAVEFMAALKSLARRLSRPSPPRSSHGA